MSKFLFFLEECIKSSDVNMITLAQKSGISKSTLYRIRKGEKEAISEELVYSLAINLGLSKSDLEMLLDFYQTEYQNEHSKRRKEKIIEILTEFGSDILAGEESFTEAAERKPVTTNKVISGWEEIRESIWQLCIEKIYYYGPIEDLILKELFLIGKKRKDIQISQIIRLNNGENQIDSSSVYNLTVLQEILKMYRSDFDYQAYFYYETVEDFDEEKKNSLSVLPVLLISESAVIALNREMTEGIVYIEKKIVDYYQNQFKRMLGDTKILIKKSRKKTEDILTRMMEKENYLVKSDILKEIPVGVFLILSKKICWVVLEETADGVSVLEINENSFLFALWEVLGKRKEMKRIINGADVDDLDEKK